MVTRVAGQENSFRFVGFISCLPVTVRLCEESRIISIELILNTFIFRSIISMVDILFPFRSLVDILKDCQILAVISISPTSKLAVRINSSCLTVPTCFQLFASEALECFYA